MLHYAETLRVRFFSNCSTSDDTAQYLTTTPLMSTEIDNSNFYYLPSFPYPSFTQSIMEPSERITSLLLFCTTEILNRFSLSEHS